ncbi:hypothetical protein, partial [Nocardia wallacei]|uniref:hypothetical protein n=1 Tax=Nocardia wallacei TaxID=480035 RepID=UPI00245427FD
MGLGGPPHRPLRRAHPPELIRTADEQRRTVALLAPHIGVLIAARAGQGISLAVLLGLYTLLAQLLALLPVPWTRPLLRVSFAQLVVVGL